jgi:hypothetical protein
VTSPHRQRGLFDVAEDLGPEREPAVPLIINIAPAGPTPASVPRSSQATPTGIAPTTGFCPVCEGLAQREARGKLWRCLGCCIAFDRPLKVRSAREAGLDRNL